MMCRCGHDCCGAKVTLPSRQLRREIPGDLQRRGRLRRARHLNSREGRRVEGHLDPATRVPMLLRQTAAARNSGIIVRLS